MTWQSTELAALRHALFTPANHIVGYTELLLEESTEEDAPAIVPELRKIHSAGRRLVKLLNDALNDLALEPGKADVATMRHAIRTPLNQIIGYGELLQEEVTITQHSELLPDLKRITDAACRLFTAVDGLFAAVPSEEQQAGEHFASADRSAPVLERPVLLGSLLVVDDNAMNRDMLTRRLEREGHRVATAEQGQQALEMLRTGSYDLALLDVMMPDMDGYEALSYLKSDPDLRDIPVIMISALDDMQSIIRCIELGAEDYLPKPFDPVLLRARIGAALEKKRLRDQEVDYLRQVDRVMSAAAAVEAGTFALDSLVEVAERDDGLGQLARLFQHMAREVKAREQRLQQQVTALRVEIDEDRKARQVAEITETDFFVELQEKAQKLRAHS